ncbi:hypothetical protein [Liquorilactobacillus mali]|uniref:Uncharacterized protein n=1 Tax=Liquorilactobacillus mali TaxID=1618 RepID=A0A0R2G7A4_9LACO|nr:hypothetical protein [Liquorilactobacillus mali]KRN33100.1 hypothetical protein IV36_GL000833 [Liquorilactobacillus mali]
MHHEKILFHGFDLDEIIFNSEVDTNAMINAQSTLFIFNCLNYKKLGCKSILVDKYRGIIRTNKETKKLINQFVDKQAITFLGTRMMAQKQGGLPYVYGKQVIIPLGGATQHSTDWLLMNNIAGIMFTENKRNMTVLFKEFLGAPLEMDFEVDKTIVRRQLRIAGNILLRQCKLVAELNDAFHDIKQSSVYNICIPCSDQDTDHSSLKSELDGGIYYVTEMALKGIMGKDVSEQLIEDTMKDIRRKSRGII